MVFVTEEAAAVVVVPEIREQTRNLLSDIRKS